MSDTVNIEYQRDVVGHPPKGTAITVERTDAIDALIVNGLAVDLDDPDLVDNHADGSVHPDPGPEEVVVAGLPVPDDGDADTDQTDGDQGDGQDASAGAETKPAAKKATKRAPRRAHGKPDND